MTISMPTAKVLTWNIERRGPDTAKAKELLHHVRAVSPEIACLTEGWQGSTLALGGYEISGRGVPWSASNLNERKVVLWSASPWADVDITGNQDCQAGGFCAGTTLTTLGAVQVIGVCIPYFHASPFGRFPRSKRWAEHRRFLQGLAAHVADRDKTVPTIILGDFNQRTPPTPFNAKIHCELVAALADLKVSTRGTVDARGSRLIDHIAVCPQLHSTQIDVLSNQDDNLGKLSDHVGVVAHIQNATT